MSPKTATLLLAQLLFLTLASLLLSSAAANIGNGCGRFHELPGLLGSYGLATGFFPYYVKNFSCRSQSNLQIELEGQCPQMRQLVSTTYVIIFNPQITATISSDKLTEIQGVTIKLLKGGLQGEFEVNEVEGYSFFANTRLLQLSLTNVESRKEVKWPFPEYPTVPGTCDSEESVDRIHRYSNNNYSSGVVAAKDSQDVPKWVNKYGRLLPAVVAA